MVASFNIYSKKVFKGSIYMEKSKENETMEQNYKFVKKSLSTAAVKWIFLGATPLNNTKTITIPLV